MTFISRVSSHIGRTLFATFGFVLCGFVLFFLVTGYDEILADAQFKIYALGIMGLFAALGISSIVLALNPAKKTPRLLDGVLAGSFIAIVVGIMFFV